MTTEERLRETEQFLREKIPLTQAMSVRVERYDEDGFVLAAPLGPNHNHLGTAFGGSLAALVMLAGYGLLWLELQDHQAHIVISESTMKFRRPVQETIRAICERPVPEMLAAFRADLGARGKARLQLRVRVATGSGETAVEFRGTYVVRR